jgi:hypothetical protein
VGADGVGSDVRWLGIALPVRAEAMRQFREGR